MPEAKQRIHLLDTLRGAAIICMVFFHAFFLMADMFGWRLGEALFAFFEPAEPFFAALFVLISGISCRLSRSNALRGARLLWIAVALTVVTYTLDVLGFGNISIWFGILHLLAFSMLFYAALGPVLDRIHPIITIVVCAVLFALTFNLELGILGFGPIKAPLPRVLSYNGMLFPFGITTSYFFSADYFPLFPWLFMFLIGTAVGKPFGEGKIPKFFYRDLLPPVTFCGRHTLIIYLVHQPVIYGILYLVSLFL